MKKYDESGKRNESQSNEGKNFKSLESSKVIIQKCLKNNNGDSMMQLE